MKNLLLTISACVLMACMPSEPTPIQEVPKIDGVYQYEFARNPSVWVDKGTGCQYWLARPNHAGQLGMSPRFDSEGKVAGCRKG